MRWVSDDRLYAKTLELLFSQASSAFASSAVAGVVLIFTFWGVSNNRISITWIVLYAAVACYRTYLRHAFFSSNEALRASAGWYTKLGTSIFVTGALWGLFLLYLATFAKGMLAAIVMANIAFILAGAVSAYAISLPLFVLFSAPIAVPSVIYLVLEFEQHAWLLAAVSLGWYLFMISAARRFSEFAIRTLAYEYDNRELVGELEEQNQRAEILAEELMVLSNTDSLTGLFNRRYFDERLETEFSRAQRTGMPMSLILCDVDFFKIYNDTLGHVEGDKCLKRLGDFLLDSIREGTDVAARYGGEEFGLVLANTDLSQAKIFAERLRRSIHNYGIPHPRSPVAKCLTLSMGIASMLDGDAQESPESMIERADRALYTAKECGRDQVRLQEL